MVSCKKVEIYYCYMLLSDVGLKPYTDTAYHNEELKSLTRYRFDKVRERAKLKQSVSRLVCILFPELEKLVPTLHMPSVYALLEEFPGTKQLASANLTRLKFLLAEASKGHYGRDMAVTIRDAARASVGSVMPAKSLELRHTIRLIRELDAEIADIETSIQSIMEELNSPITTIPGIGFRMAAMILAEVGDFSRFDSPDKVLAYTGLSPSTYQSGQLNNCCSFKENLRIVLDALLGLGAIVVVIVGTSTGICSAIEAAAIAAVYSLFVTVCIYRNMSLKLYVSGLMKCLPTLGMAMSIIAASSVFSYVMNYLKVPQHLTTWLLLLTSNTTLLTLLLLLMMLILGYFMDIGILILVTTPILYPIAVNGLGFNPYHFGVVLVLAYATASACARRRWALPCSLAVLSPKNRWNLWSKASCHSIWP